MVNSVFCLFAPVSLILTEGIWLFYHIELVAKIVDF